MNIKFFFKVIFLFFLISLLSGCLQESVKVENDFEGISFKSDVVELVYAKKTERVDNNKILGIDIKFLFKNPNDRYIDLDVYVEFYDKEDHLITKEGPHNIGIRPNYEEKLTEGANTISYNGEHASLVDHVIIIAEEI